MKMNFSFANRLMNDFFLLACYANGGMPETAEEIADTEQWAKDTFLTITSVWEEEMDEEWEIEMDEEEEEEEDECGDTCPCCYDDEDNLWNEEEYNRPSPCDQDCDCGECYCGDCCMGEEEDDEPAEITNPNYAEVDKEIAKVFESFGLEAPEAEDMEDIHRLMDTMSSILSEVVNKCSES